MDTPATVNHIPHVAIIGGGVTGLAAGFYLEQATRAAGIALDFTVIEQSGRTGGKIHTDTIGDLIVESGADSFLTQKPWALDLVRDLGLADECLPINTLKQPTYVLIAGVPQPMTAGMVLGVPTRLGPFLRSPLLSPWGKLRALADLAYPARQRQGDESLAGCMRRHFGGEFVDRVAEPLMSGIHNSLAEEQSLLATFPRFRESEHRYGSLIRGAIAARSLAQLHATTPPQPPFLTLRGGMGRLIGALTGALGERVRHNLGVVAITHDPATSAPYHIRLNDGTMLDADAVILTTPAFVSADIIAAQQPQLADRLRAIRYVSTGTVSLAYDRTEVGALPGFGVIIPRSERRQINAITITSRKFAHRAGADQVLIRAFIGGSHRPDAIAQSDAAILRTVSQEFHDILGITAAPRVARIWRLRDSSPQYDVGHLARVDAIDALCPPGLALAGSAYRGVGIPDCVKQARDAVARTLTLIAPQSQSRHHHDGKRVMLNER